MTVVNSSTLFHFTKKNANLKKIVQKGLRFSYSFETFSKQVILNEILPGIMHYPEDIILGDDSKEYGVAIPMVCFCDIPLLRISEHKLKYGDYVIGFDKGFLSECYNPILNPVWYMDSDIVLNSVLHFSKMGREVENGKLELIKKWANNPTLKAKIEKDGSDVIFKNDELKDQLLQLINTKFFVNTLLGYCKPYDYKNSKNKYICNYDEREWRAIIHDNINEETNWAWGVDKDAFKSYKDEWNKKIETCDDGFITIPEGSLQYAITHVIVKTDNEIWPMIKLIMNSKSLFGEKNISYDERLILVSKVTSFERIEMDY